MLFFARFLSIDQELRTKNRLLRSQSIKNYVTLWLLTLNGELQLKFETLCAIWYDLYNLKNVKNTHGGALLLVKLHVKACSFNKSNTPLLYRCFSRFLSCINGTKSRKAWYFASHSIFFMTNVIKWNMNDGNFMTSLSLHGWAMCGLRCNTDRTAISTILFSTENFQRKSTTVVNRSFLIVTNGESWIDNY